MNIGMVTDTFWPRINGVVHSIQSFTDVMRRWGHRVYIFAPEFPEHKDQDADVWRFPAHISQHSKEDRISNPFLKGSRQLMKKLPDLGLDIVHTHTPFSLGIAFLAWAKRHHVPVVHTYHTLFEAYVPYYLKGVSKPVSHFIVNGMSRAICNRHDLIITPSRAMRRVLLQYKVKRPIRVIATGVDLRRFAGADRFRMRQKLGIADYEKLLLVMGRIAGEKNIPFILQAFAHIHARHPHARLVVAGDGPAAQEVKERALRLGVAEWVLFPGYVRGQDWADLHAGADLLLLASLTETQGLVLTEAMAAHTPLVAVAAMGVRDVMAGGGGLAVPMNLAKFVAAVDRMLSDPDFYEQKKNETLQVAQSWSIERKTRELLETYEDVITARAKKKKTQHRRIQLPR